MHAVLDHSPISAFTIDLADRVTTWNAAAARYFDLPEAAALAGRFRDLDISYQVPGLRAAVETMKLAAAPAALSLGAISFVRRTGTPAEAVFTVAPMFRSGRPIGVCIWAEDRERSLGLEATIETLSIQLTGLSGEHEELQTINEELKTSREQLQEVCVELERANGVRPGGPSPDLAGGPAADDRTLARDNALLRTELVELRFTHTALLGTLTRLQRANRRLRERVKLPTPT